MKTDFLKYQAQTSQHPLALSISHAKGNYIYDTNQKKYLDFVAGVSACTLGHQHPKLNKAIKNQLDKYAHVMVYGEYDQSPAVAFCKLLAQQLPPQLDTTYMVNSGAEATEGALKLARRVTGRSQFIACHNAYHGNTMGAMSVMGYEDRKQAYRPLLPDIDFISFNNIDDLEKITTKTAAIILETIQGGAGFIQPENDFLKKVRQRCNQVGALMILDEIQPGFGRTGKLFGFMNFDITPDILVMGKGMGGGMPVGAFTASSAMMQTLSHSPTLGHITTFGGHPVIAAACLETLQQLLQTKLIAQTITHEKQFKKHLKHPLIRDIRGRGLMLAIITPSAEITTQIILRCQQKGLILFWLLFDHTAIRITPPLTITKKQIIEGCNIILQTMNEIMQETL